ncbi:putative glycoprotein [Culex rhabdo-like virus Los Angeles]|uniref:Glycoprotein n=1 Tax=Culex rhabdo-like virus Los Angeles TaxID=2849718 RepID=A0A346M1Z8_9RHAB|nr:putative glycoprotein [Culex rhabdo-like virus]AXQ04773.1 putative glycoprotein [Culex rhabdo-like virus Los Angeles]AXQ04839.1 hypothetical protein [Culex mosquito virus 2]
MITFFYFAFSSLSSWAAAEHLLFPISVDLQWHPTMTSNLKCPSGQKYHKINTGVRIPVKIPNLGNSPSVSGHVCTATILTTSCSTGFFGGTTLTLLSSPSTLTESECQDSISEYLIGNIMSNEHPSPVCSWMKNSSTSRKIITVTPMRVYYDPYHNKLLSSIFLTGECTSSFCLTVFGNKVWISSESITSYCKDRHMEPSSLILYQSNKTFSVLWSSELDTSSLVAPCIMTFCGEKGIRFDTGNWVALDKAEIPRIDWVGEYFYNLVDCPVDSTINIVDQQERLHYAMLSLTENFFDEECMLTKSKLNDGLRVSRIELQTFIPRVPGYFPVYMYSPGSFLVSTSKYKLVNAVPVSEFPYVGFFDHDGREYTWNYWKVSNVTNIIDGPNGLYVINKTLIYGMNDIDEYKTIYQLSGKHKILTIDQLENKSSAPLVFPSSVDYQFSDDASLSDVVWNSSKHFMLYIMIILSVLMSAIWLIFLCLKKQHFIKRSVLPIKPSQLDREMEFFRP